MSASLLPFEVLWAVALMYTLLLLVALKHYMDLLMVEWGKPQIINQNWLQTFTVLIILIHPYIIKKFTKKILLEVFLCSNMTVDCLCWFFRLSLTLLSSLRRSWTSFAYDYNVKSLKFNFFCVQLYNWKGQGWIWWKLLDSA